MRNKSKKQSSTKVKIYWEEPQETWTTGNTRVVYVRTKPKKTKGEK